MKKKKTEEKQSTNNNDLQDFIKSLSKSLSIKDEDKVERFISTGSTLLDYAISNQRNGGVPVSRLTEITGEESSGKTLIAAQILVNTQKQGGIGVYIDTEHSANKEFMERIGINWDMLLKPTCQTVEEVFETIEKVIIMTREKFPQKEKPVTIVWDSIAATPARAEIEGDFDPNGRMGICAKAMSLGMRKLTESIDFGYVTMVFLNQLRQKMNLDNKYADPWIAPYGKAVPFHASVRIRLHSFSKIKDEMDDKMIWGIRCRAKTVKSKISPPFREVEFPIMFSDGVDDAQSIYDYLHAKGKIEKTKGYSVIQVNGKAESFRHAEWKEKYLGDAKFKSAIDDLLEEMLVIKYENGKAPLDEMNIDVESAMEVEEIDAAMKDSK